MTSSSHLVPNMLSSLPRLFFYSTGTDDENNDSDAELVIDTEKLDNSDKYDPGEPIDSEESSKEETVSSSVDASFVSTNNPAVSHATAHSTSELQSEKVQSTDEMQEEEVDEDGCPNFSIYSTESINLAKSTDLELLNQEEITSTPEVEVKKRGNTNALYSDAEDDVNIEVPKSFGIGDLQNMTEDISEEERSYTPCLDENAMKSCLDGLDTELISDEDRNDFDESHELKTASDGDALEINVKESELDFTKAEDCEEGEIVDKSKQQDQVVEVEPEEQEELIVVVVTNNESEKPNKPEFKKLSKSNKERNYRDKERSSRSRSKERKERKKEKRKEIERYDVRSIIAEKPRRLKDKFGRDKRSESRSSRSGSRNRRSVSRKRRRRSSYTRSRSPERRKRSSRRRERSRSRHRPRKRSSSVEVVRVASPSWTPPRVVDNMAQPHNFTVILTNDANKKQEKKKKKSDKKVKESEKKKKRRNKTTPPSKEVFASGDNILVSVSFNKDNETRDVTTKRKQEHAENVPPKRVRKANRTKKIRDLSDVKPVAIIDLVKSPFKEITPSPKAIIVLSDSDNGESNEIQKAACDSSQRVASPEVPQMGPKTPPEPQVKFSLNPKPQQLRQITNPLHESDEAEAETEAQEEHPPEVLVVVHKGPNTPPDPPNSPPSSPDAYDPFEPTKSRSATPEPNQTNTQSNNSISVDNETRQIEVVEKAVTTPPDVVKSHTPPLLETQPDSQSSSILTNTPENRPKSPEVALNVQAPTITSKPVASALPYSPTPSSAASLITITPAVARINLINSTILAPTNVNSTPQQRIVQLLNPGKFIQTKLPIKSTPIKPMPTKNALINKRKPPTKNDSSEVVALDFDSPYSPGSSDYDDLFEPPPEGGVKPQKTKPQSSNSFDSLFGSSPVYGGGTKSKAVKKGGKKSTPLPSKGNRVVDAGDTKENYVMRWVLGTKQIGVKLDEDNLKILDELPNSAVEMQVKDKVVFAVFVLLFRLIVSFAVLEEVESSGEGCRGGEIGVKAPLQQKAYKQRGV